MKATMLAVAALLAALPLAMRLQSLPREDAATTAAARRDLDRRFLQSRQDMSWQRREAWLDMRREQDRRTPEGLRVQAQAPQPER
jgi:hypothetical protein